jgi:hypothetical protein
MTNSRQWILHRTRELGCLKHLSQSAKDRGGVGGRERKWGKNKYNSFELHKNS